ncbi:hypothetical protein Bbelb_401200 [Branchiostoma belcheri]|nr:hypothetical protein Bbelb_401200 [Branchiostoma belcheri]
MTWLGNITPQILQEILDKYNMTREDFIGAFNLTPRVYVTELSPSAKTVTLVSYIVIFLAALLGNSLVVFVVWKNKGMRTTMNIFICSLAASDLLITIFCIPVTLMQNMLKNWILGDFMCKLVPFIQGHNVGRMSRHVPGTTRDRTRVSTFHSRTLYHYATWRKTKLNSDAQVDFYHVVSTGGTRPVLAIANHSVSGSALTNRSADVHVLDELVRKL